jgi:drug/metabolite transporter (DMT)-like permease
MVAVIGGLGAALAFAVTTLCASRSSRMLGARSTLAWVMIVGFVVAAPVAAFEGVPSGLDARSAGWLAASGCGNVGGLLLTYAALRIGKVGIVAPIVSTEGAIAAVISVAAGERLEAASYAVLALIAVGVVLGGAGSDEDGGGRAGARPVVLAAAGACFFGISLYATGRVGAELPIFWAVLPARLVGIVAVAVPLIMTRKLTLTRPAVPLVVAGGLAEVAGFASYVIGARHGLAVSAVLASQFGGLAALVAFFLYRERLRPLQVVGIAVIVAGVAALSAIQH